jgi:hypothetical protein
VHAPLHGQQQHHQQQDPRPGRAAELKRAGEAVAQAMAFLHDDRTYQREEGQPDETGHDEQGEADGGADDEDEVGGREPPPGQRAHHGTEVETVTLEVLVTHRLVQVAGEDHRAGEVNERDQEQADHVAEAADQADVRLERLAEAAQRSGQDRRRQEQDQGHTRDASTVPPQHAPGLPQDPLAGEGPPPRRRTCLSRSPGRGYRERKPQARRCSVR